MRPRKNIENLIKEFDIDVNPKKDRQILDELRQEQTKSKKSGRGATVIDIWRIIMQSKITKYAMAAIILVAALFGINQFGGSIDGSAVALARAVENTRRMPWRHRRDNHGSITWYTIVRNSHPCGAEFLCFGR